MSGTTPLVGTAADNLTHPIAPHIVPDIAVRPKYSVNPKEATGQSVRDWQMPRSEDGQAAASGPGAAHGRSCDPFSVIRADFVAIHFAHLFTDRTGPQRVHSRGTNYPRRCK
ncbi:hypothetical protein GCM10010160_39080 [Acrocarpospora corrugata]